MILVFLLASLIVLIAMFAYAKYSAKKSLSTEKASEVEREFIKAEKEEIRKTEETGYSEKDEREEYEDDGSDDYGE
ncbi:hypothetical protein ACSAZL_11020 [Methanosarcina sp. T3]|uniref:hypothetical protein n=1 Tax=Methanosarcina sp. T3 TaxID=3439062 RepID=UPI003F86A57D